MAIRTIRTGKPYQVISQEGILTEAGIRTGEIFGEGKVMVVTDSNVDPLYGDAVLASLLDAGVDARRMVFPPGEETKSLDALGRLLETLAEQTFTRTDGILALGGGVIGDLSGFAAATYLRGVRYIQVPTTFLAAADSSVGGKTGVNLRSGKNLAGAFWQPSLVLFDPAVLTTLQDAAIRDGLAESIKCAMISDASMFGYLSAHREGGLPKGDALLPFAGVLVDGAVSVKQRVVEEDERDLGTRQLLNFGHTIGHAIETLSGYAISHGHAVAMGMALMTRAAQEMGWSEEDCLSPLLALLKGYGFPLEIPFSPAQLAEVALKDKKRAGAMIQLVIPRRIGDCILRPYPAEELEKLIRKGLSK